MQSNKLTLASALLTIGLIGSSCASNSTDDEQVKAAPPPNELNLVLEQQSDEHKARYPYRHPKETLEFFDLQPGMTVVEVLPGGGWYSQILVPYLGPEGTLIAADYPMAMWPNFDWVNEEFIANRGKWGPEWQQKALAWGGEKASATQAYNLDTLPESLNNSVDAVLFIRALHNLARFEDKGKFLTNAIKESHRVLKPGGIIGVVQHKAPESATDSWADGSKGYLKESFLVDFIEQQGFELIGRSDVNKNPKDQPGVDDIVWRLPPSFYTSGNNLEMREKYAKIGESNRMTLKFRKR